LTETKIGMVAERNHLRGFDGAWMGADLGSIIPVAISGKDGRFRLPNIGTERVVDVLVSGPNVETRTFKVSTREHPTIIADEWERRDRMMPGSKLQYVGNNFDMALNHGRTVNGVVTDAKTGQPLAGAKVYEFQLANDPDNHAPVPRRPQTTDAQGKYTITGLPIKGRNIVVAVGPQGQAYLQQQKSVPQPEGFGSATLDFELVEGTILSVRSVDKVTRQPVRGTPLYFTLANNTAVQTIQGYSHPVQEFVDRNFQETSFTIVVPPGPGLVAFRSSGTNNYMMAVGLEQFKDAMTNENAFINTRPYYVTPSNYNNLVRIEPKVGQKTLDVVVELDNGQAVKGRVVPPKGTTLTGTIELQHLKPSIGLGGEVTPLTTPEFTVEGLRAGQRRLIVARVPEQQLTGSAVVSLEQKTPLEVKLVPWATVRGQALDADGKPLAKARLAFLKASEDSDATAGFLPNEIYTDADGKFTITGLTPGLKYRVGILANARIVLNLLEGTTFKPGETRDLGEIRAKMD
jgi:hypothetical protein